ncbi:hypothetical protein [Solimicrobium silvestre]|uniref:Uncharacterized protein n=1 Tax=Solimicrobium silvestre TaxID=2099400 RepID=A0A2S9H1F9_9BURK|nr:hypothetical protein [Solimicrobium silvestre]PRC93821.1 hypothetical protein S2091_1430 [Solimicrobium silvestre]
MNIKQFPLVARYLVAFILCCFSLTALAQATDLGEFKDGAWVSYRDAYLKMIRFEKYGGPKQFIQNNLRVVVTDKKTSMDGLRLILEGKNTHLNLLLDPIGRAIFPMLKTAYDDNAELRVNRPDNSVTFEYRISIFTRPDGVYDVSDLRSACDQVLHYLRYQDLLRYTLKQCIGVKFSYLKDQYNISLKAKINDQNPVSISLSDGSVFNEDNFNMFKVGVYKFIGGTEKGQIISSNVPLAITAIIE